MRLRKIGGAALLAAVVALAAAGSASAAEGGLEIFPDFDLSDPASWPGSRFVQLIALFVLLVYPVNRVVLSPLLRVLEERAARIDGARRRASEVTAQADAVLARYQSAVEQARLRADELRKGELSGARSEQAELLSAARHAAEAEVANARQGVARALRAARAELARHTEALAREAAARVLGRTLS
jgi:F-type H+-transporting ATPase subunit b